MANREIEAKLILSAADKTGKAFRSVSGKLNDVNKQAKVYNKNGRSNAQTALAVGRAAAIASTAVAAVGIASYKNFAGDERTLTRIGITADATREQMEQIREELFKTADATGLQFNDMILGLDALTASGRTLEESMALLPSVATTAQASGAQMADIATSADALFTSMNIKAKDMQGAFDILVAGGKAGKFELKDMAQYLPSLAPAFKALGYEGEAGVKRLVSALQTVRKETGTSGEAATAFSDVLTKMESQTVTNNFKKFGVDLRDSLSKAREEGKDILATFRELAVEAVDGDLSKLPQLFTDKQMLIGMRSLINGAESGKELFASLGNVDGSAMKDLNKLLEDNQAKLDDLSLSWDRFSSSVGSGIAPFVGGAMDGVSDFIDRGDAIAEGQKADGLSLWQRVARNGSLSQDDPQMIEWAKKGGWKPPAFDGGSKGSGDIAVPMGSPLGAEMGSDNIPIPVSRNPRGKAPVFESIKDIQIRLASNPKMLSDEDLAFSQTAAGQPHLAPSLNDEQSRAQGGMTGAPVRVDTAMAKTAIDDLNTKAEQPMQSSVELDTTAAEAKLDKLQMKVRSIQGIINSGSSGRNLGRSMPDAGQ